MTAGNNVLSRANQSSHANKRNRITYDASNQSTSVPTEPSYAHPANKHHAGSGAGSSASQYGPAFFPASSKSPHRSSKAVKQQSITTGLEQFRYHDAAPAQQASSLAASLTLRHNKQPAVDAPLPVNNALQSAANLTSPKQQRSERTAKSRHASSASKHRSPPDLSDAAAPEEIRSDPHRFGPLSTKAGVASPRDKQLRSAAAAPNATPPRHAQAQPSARSNGMHTPSGQSRHHRVTADGSQLLHNQSSSVPVTHSYNHFAAAESGDDEDPPHSHAQPVWFGSAPQGFNHIPPVNNQPLSVAAAASASHAAIGTPGVDTAMSIPVAEHVIDDQPMASDADDDLTLTEMIKRASSNGTLTSPSSAAKPAPRPPTPTGQGPEPIDSHAAQPSITPSVARTLHITKAATPARRAAANPYKPLNSLSQHSPAPQPRTVSTANKQVKSSKKLAPKPAQTRYPQLSLLSASASANGNEVDPSDPFASPELPLATAASTLTPQPLTQTVTQPHVPDRFLGPQLDAAVQHAAESKQSDFASDAYARAQIESTPSLTTRHRQYGATQQQPNRLARSTYSSAASHRKPKPVKIGKEQAISIDDDDSNGVANDTEQHIEAAASPSALDASIAEDDLNDMRSLPVNGQQRHANLQTIRRVTIGTRTFEAPSSTDEALMHLKFSANAARLDGHHKFEAELGADVFVIPLWLVSTVRCNFLFEPYFVSLQVDTALLQHIDQATSDMNGNRKQQHARSNRALRSVDINGSPVAVPALSAAEYSSLQDFVSRVTDLYMDELSFGSPWVMYFYCTSAEDVRMAASALLKQTQHNRRSREPHVNALRFAADPKLLKSAAEWRQLDADHYERYQKYQRVTTQATATVHLVYAPSPIARNSVEISERDMQCLEDGEFLNDSIVNFYLRYIEHQLVPADQRHRFYTFSTYFYTKYTTSGFRLKDKHAGVARWTRGVDLFEHDYIIVPINDSLHWSVAIVCFARRWAEAWQQFHAQQPPLAASGQAAAAGVTRSPTPTLSQNLFRTLTKVWSSIFKSKATATDGNDSGDADAPSNDASQYFAANDRQLPVLLYFDSLGTAHGPGPASRQILQYLTTEWQTRKSDQPAVDFNKLPVHALNLPQQTNSCDCGLYLLQYVELFCKQPFADMREFALKQYETWFPTRDIAKKRRQITAIIEALRRQQVQDKSAEAASTLRTK